VRRFSLALALLAGCTAPSYHSGALQCATVGRACPDHFHCATDRHCWKDGEDPMAGADLGGVDLAGVDLAGSDLAMTLPMDLGKSDLARRDLSMSMMTSDMSTPGSCATAKICDSFDVPTLNARWTNDTNNGTIAVDNARAYRGASSLHLHTSPAPAANSEPQANVFTYQGLPVATTVYLRAWVYFPSTNPTDFDQILNFANAGGSGIAYIDMDNHPNLNDYTTGGPYNLSTLFTIPTDKWTCLQMEIPQNASTGVIKLFLDGAEVTDVTSASTAPTPSLDHVYVGLDFYGNPANLPAADMWLDELIVDDKPTTCAE
jgi:hypothetical protein